MCTRSEPINTQKRANMRFMSTYYTYGRPIKPHHTRVYESRAEFEYVNRSDAFTTRQLTAASGFENRKGDTVKIPMSRHTCRKRGAPFLPPTAGERLLSASVFQSLICCLTCRQLFFSPFKRSADSFNWTPNAWIKGRLFRQRAYFTNRFFLRAVTPTEPRTYLLTQIVFSQFVFQYYIDLCQAIFWHIFKLSVQFFITKSME